MRSIPLLAALLTACATSRAAAPAGVPAQVALDQGSSASANGLTLRFVGVESDSRCPPGTQCVWEGVARVDLVATASGAPAGALRLTTLRDSSAARIAGYQVQLDSLSPRAAGERYRAWLTVGRLPADR